METFLRIFLPIYFISYFGIAFVARGIIIAKRIGKSPLILQNDGSAYGLMGFYFKCILIILFMYIFFFAFFPAYYNILLPIPQLDIVITKYIGLVLLVLAFIITVIAQEQMKNSWRIGIDTETKTELITTGLFQLTRNPIYLGLLLCLMGLFLTTPNALTSVFFILGYVLIQIQIRLEEEFLTKQHGETYLAYKNKVRRLI